jgi:Ca2+-binding EF-hand superfamily protein
MFNVFDLESNKLIQFKELVLIFTSLVRGYCLLTHQNLPDHSHIQKYAQIMFSRADLNNDQNL